MDAEDIWEVSYCVEDDQDVQRAAAALQLLKEDLESFVLAKADTTPYKKPPRSEAAGDGGGSETTAALFHDASDDAATPNRNDGDSCDASADATRYADRAQSPTQVDVPPRLPTGPHPPQDDAEAPARSTPSLQQPPLRQEDALPSSSDHRDECVQRGAHYDSEGVFHTEAAPAPSQASDALPPPSAEDAARSRFITQLLMARRKGGAAGSVSQGRGGATFMASRPVSSTGLVPSPYTTHPRNEEDVSSVSPTVSCASQQQPPSVGRANPVDKPLGNSSDSRRYSDWTEVFFQRGHLTTPRTPSGGGTPADRDAVFHDLIRVSDDIARGSTSTRSAPQHPHTTSSVPPLPARSQHQPGGTDSTAPPSISLSPVPTDAYAQPSPVPGDGGVSPPDATHEGVNLHEMEQDAAAPVGDAAARIGGGAVRTTSPLYHYPEDATPRGDADHARRETAGVASGNTPAYVFSDGTTSTPNLSARRSTSGTGGIPPSSSRPMAVAPRSSSPSMTQQRLFATISPPPSGRSPMPGTPRGPLIADDGWRPPRKTRVGALTPDTKRATTRTEKTFDGSVAPSSIAAVELIEHVAQRQSGGEGVTASSPPTHLPLRALRSSSPQTHPMQHHPHDPSALHGGAHPPPHSHPIVLPHGGVHHEPLHPVSDNGPVLHGQRERRQQWSPPKVPPLPMQRLEECMASTNLPKLHAQRPAHLSSPPTTAGGDTLSSPWRQQSSDPSLHVPRADSGHVPHSPAAGDGTDADTPNRAAAAAALRRRSVTFV